MIVLRRLGVALTLLFVLVVPLAAQSRALWASLDSAQVSTSGEEVFLLTRGWAAADGARPGVGLFIDGQFVTSMFTEDRTDVCAALTSMGYQCSDSERFHACDANAIYTTSCVGVNNLISLTSRGIAPGTHWVRLCATHLEADWLVPQMACSNQIQIVVVIGRG